MSMLAELVEVVIGVDTHKHTYPAAVPRGQGGAGPCDRHRRRTRTYADRRRVQGKLDRGIKRCLKGYIIRELYGRLETPPSIS